MPERLADPPPRHPTVGRHISPGLPAGGSPKMGHEPFRDLLLARHSRVPFPRRTATITTDHSPLRPNQGGRIGHCHITDTSPEPAMTDHLDRPAMKTRRRQRRHNRHFQLAINNLSPNHLHIRQTNRNFDTITHQSPPCFVGFVTNKARRAQPSPPKTVKKGFLTGFLTGLLAAMIGSMVDRSKATAPRAGATGWRGAG